MSSLVELKPKKQLADAEPNQSWLDFWGLAASVGCAIHCAMMPFVIAYLPVLGLSWLADEAFHFWMAIVCFAIAITSFVPGFRKHGNLIPLGLGAVGVTILLSHSLFGCDCCSGCSATELQTAGTAACTSCECCSTEICKNEPPTVPFSKAISPWLPPVGGLFLIVAHLVNHFKGCREGCC